MKRKMKMRKVTVPVIEEDLQAPIKPLKTNTDCLEVTTVL